MSTEAPLPFKLLEKVGDSGAIEFFRARQVPTERDVLVKLVRPELANDPVPVGRLADEAKVTASLRHSNIVEHVASGWLADGRPFLALELLHGPTLRTQLSHAGPLLPLTLARLLVPLCRALHHAHSRGVIHRDLRPENVVLSGGVEKFAPKLVEFAKASFRGTPTVLSGADALASDPRYLAPECIDGQPADARSELYALGVLAFEAATGALPFSAPTESELLLSHLQDPPPHLPAHAAALDLVVQRCLAKQPSARFASAEEVAAALEEVLATAEQRKPAPPAPVAAEVTASPSGGVEPENGVAGSYDLVRLLGKGAMGNVYLATHRRLGKQVAIKVLRPEHCRDHALMQRFFQEARAVNEINHEHIVEIHDFVEEPGRAYCVMELLTGSNLRALMDRELLTIPRIVQIAEQLCAALGAAHRVGVIHRDVKPDNIFITRRSGAEYVKVLDFGVAKLMKPVAGATTKTLEGSIIGTPLYMAPEQAMGKAVDPRADIYSVGAVLYELLAGRPPFQDDAVAALMVKILSAPVPPLPVHAVSGERIPSALATLVMRCLQREQRRRPESMSEVRRDLGRCLPQKSAEAGQRPGRGWLALALGVVALVSMGWAVWQTPGAVDREAVREWIELKRSAILSRLGKGGALPAPSPPATSRAPVPQGSPGERPPPQGRQVGAAVAPLDPAAEPSSRVQPAPAPGADAGSDTDSGRYQVLEGSPDAGSEPGPQEVPRPREDTAAPEATTPAPSEELALPVELEPNTPSVLPAGGSSAVPPPPRPLVIELHGDEPAAQSEPAEPPAQMERAPAVGRNGMGAPVIEIGPDGRTRIIDAREHGGDPVDVNF